MTDDSPAMEQIAGDCDPISQPRKPSDIEDRRANHPRMPLVMEFEAVLLDDPNHASIRIILKDISMHGAAFHTSHPIQVDERIMIVMPFANRAGRTILCQVRHSRKVDESLYLAGAEFLDAVRMQHSRGPARIPAKWLPPRFGQR